MIEKITKCDKIEFVAPYSVQCRQRISLVEDGNELAASFHRSVMHPDSDWSQAEANVQAICNAVFTDAVKADWAAKQAADAAQMATDGASTDAAEEPAATE
jgi:hypothetical protein